MRPLRPNVDLLRMCNKRLTKVYQWSPTGQGLRGRPSKRWADCVADRSDETRKDNTRHLATLSGQAAGD